MLSSRWQVAGCGSQVAGDRSQVAGDRSQVAGDRSQVAGDRSQVAGDRSQVAGDRSQVAGHISLRLATCVLFIFMAIPLLNCEVFAAEPAAQKLIPADEGESDASFRAFREQLLKAVREHDAGVIREILDPKIVLAYPDEEKKIRKFGTADFMKMWQPDNDYTPLWDTLETILLMGGTFTDEKKGQYVTPYVYSLWPKDIEPSEYSAIVGTHINVREQPDFNSQVIARLSHDIVKVDYKASQEKWRKIITGDGKAGYVFEAFIRSKYDWSAGFAKTGEKWVMKWLVSKPLSRRIPYPEP